jgi:NAD(P)-dependent dehydrogenase (short-subunit alcohol dehydrogenase family)
MDYSERVVLVTGASSGIGECLALDFARRGARLVIAARRGARLLEVAEACTNAGATVEAQVGDLAERDFAESMVAAALARFGRLDVLVNNAGVPKHKQIYDVTPEDVESTLRINFMAPALLTLAALPAMLRQGEGWIVNISSIAGRVAPPRESIYAASKFALTGFTEGLALDLAGSNIHPAVIHVGAIDTEIWEKAESPHRFRGRKHPPSLVSAAVFRCIEQRRHEMTVPRSLRGALLFGALAPGLFRRGAARYDPVAREVVAEARRRAKRPAH